MSTVTFNRNEDQRIEESSQVGFFPRKGGMSAQEFIARVLLEANTILEERQQTYFESSENAIDAMSKVNDQLREKNFIMPESKQSRALSAFSDAINDEKRRLQDKIRSYDERYPIWAKYGDSGMDREGYRDYVRCKERLNEINTHSINELWDRATSDARDSFNNRIENDWAKDSARDQQKNTMIQGERDFILQNGQIISQRNSLTTTQTQNVTNAQAQTTSIFSAMNDVARKNTDVIFR